MTDKTIQEQIEEKENEITGFDNAVQDAQAKLDTKQAELDDAKKKVENAKTEKENADKKLETAKEEQKTADKAVDDAKTDKNKEEAKKEGLTLEAKTAATEAVAAAEENAKKATEAVAAAEENTKKATEALTNAGIVVAEGSDLNKDVKDAAMAHDAAVTQLQIAQKELEALNAKKIQQDILDRVNNTLPAGESVSDKATGEPATAATTTVEVEGSEASAPGETAPAPVASSETHTEIKSVLNPEEVASYKKKRGVATVGIVLTGLTTFLSAAALAGTAAITFSSQARDFVVRNAVKLFGEKAKDGLANVLINRNPIMAISAVAGVVSIIGLVFAAHKSHSYTAEIEKNTSTIAKTEEVKIGK